MKKYLVFSSFLLILIMSTAGVLAAKPDFQAAQVINPVTGQAKNTVIVPARAVEVSPGIFSLGQATDPQTGELVEGYAILKFAPQPAKPGSSSSCGNEICEPGENAKKCPADCGGEEPTPDTSSCYGFLSHGAKWKSVEPYIVDGTNDEGLSSSFVKSNLAFDISKWETAAGTDILGDEINGTVNGADTVSPDGKNEVMFGSISSPGAIAVAIVWGRFNGPPPARYLAEWDIVFDQVDFNWSDNGDPTAMDFENIATHELGHCVGMDDLYTPTCSQQTMYGYASEGETNKRTLEAGDMTGIRELY